MTEAHGAAGLKDLPDIPNLLTLILQWMPEGPAKHFLHTWETAIFVFVIIGIVGGLMALAARRVAMRPGRGQMLAEIVIEGLEDLVCGVLGKEHGRRFLPFLGTLFLFILAQAAGMEERDLAGRAGQFLDDVEAFAVQV